MPQTELESILDFCLETFLKFGLPEDQVDIEIPGHMRRMQLRKVFSSPTRRPIRSFHEISLAEGIGGVFAEAGAGTGARAEVAL
ncbi:unnamed protein product [Penicillium discolor]